MDDRYDRIENIEYRSLLYDFYGGLLSDSQREVMDLYHEDDMSLAEIAEELSQTRQGVHYTLKKAEAALERYEDKLGLIRAMNEKAELAAEAESIAASLAAKLGNGTAGGGDCASADKLIELIRRLAE